MTKRFLLFLSLVLCGVDAQAVQFRANISWTAPSSYLNATVFTDAADACAQYVAFKGTEWSVGTVMYNPHVGSPQDGRVSSTYYLCSTEHTGGSLRNVHYYNLYVRCEVGDSWVPAPTTLAALGCETEPPPEPCGTEYGAELGGVSPAELATFGTETPACVNNCKANIFLSFFTSGGTPQSKYAWYSTGEDCTGETEATGTAEESACVDNFEQNQNPVVPGYNSGLCVDQADPGDVLYRARDQHIGEDLQEPIGDDIGASRTRVTSDGGDLLLGFTSDPNGGTDLGYGWDLDYIPGRCTHYGHGTGAYTLCGSNAIATNSDGTPATPFGSITVNRPGNFQQTVNFYEGFVHSGGANGPGITEGGGLPGSSGGGGTTGGGGGGGDGDCVGSDCGEGDSSISGGTSCDAAPTCDGDPIQCYIAKKEWEIWCSTQIPSDSDLDAAISEGLTDNGQTVEQYLEGQTFDAGEWFDLPEANACTIEDIQISIPFLGDATIPLSDFCELFSVIGLFVLAGAALKSLHIVLQGLG